VKIQIGTPNKAKIKNLQEIITNIDHHRGYYSEDGILYKHSSRKSTLMVIPGHLTLEITGQYHGSQFSGHFGTTKTIKRILKSGFWWSSMHQDVKLWIKKCKLCQHIKSPRKVQHHEGITSGSYPFQRISMDFFGAIHQSANTHRYILVVMDTFTKYVHIYPAHSTTTIKCTRIMYENFILQHGVPEEILSDNGPPFSSSFIEHLSNFMGIRQLFAPAMHPQSNSIVEKFMQNLKNLILCYTNQDIIQQQWDIHLRLLQFVYNTTPHLATNFTPFYFVLGRHPRTPLVTIDRNAANNKENKVYAEHHFATSLQQRLHSTYDLIHHVDLCNR
jgi:hypothetical protein